MPQIPDGMSLKSSDYIINPDPGRIMKIDPGRQHLFLSDVHIGAISPRHDRQLEEQLIDILEYCETQNWKLYILGDLFDWWMEYPQKHPDLGQRFLEKAELYHKNNDPILYITGNHDNWTRGHLHNYGFEVEHEYRVLQAGEEQIMVFHGDGLSDTQFGYQRPLLHRLLRNPRFIKLYQRILPPSMGWRAMKLFSDFSKWLETREPAERAKILDNWISQLFEKSTFKKVICGHDHHPRFLSLCRDCQYVNLGAFFRHKTMALYTRGNLDLVIWQRNQGVTTIKQSETNKLRTSSDPI